MAIFHLLKIRTSIDIIKNEKCKVTFGLEYSSNRRTDSPVNVKLTSRPGKSTKHIKPLVKMPQQTLTLILITHINPSSK